VGPRVSQDRCEKSRLNRDSGPSSPQPVAIPTELPGTCCLKVNEKLINKYFISLNFKYSIHTHCLKRPNSCTML
jgi:hypothetical protein